MSEPSSTAMPAERIELVRAFVQDRQRATVADIVSQFAVSPATARRMLAALADRGDVRRVRGGAIAASPAGPEPPVLLRAAQQAAAKARIGKAAADLVVDGDTVFLSSGTTALEVARCLGERSGLTVVTNSIPVMSVLMDATGVEVVVLGGLLRRSEQSLIGHLSELGLQEVRASKVILGIRGVHPQHGLTNDYLPETQTDRAVLAMGASVVLVADHTKCGAVSTAYVGPVSAVDVLVTDSAAPDAFVHAMAAGGVRVVLA